MSDLDAVFHLVEKAVEQMNCGQIDQWDQIYPAKSDFQNDIRRNELYVGIIGETIAVVYALNRYCDEQYRNGAWQYTGDNFIVLHRLCVSPAFQHKGVAHAVLDHIESESAARGINAIRLDVFSRNPYALKLYGNNGYHTVGTADWRKGRFLLMEKLLETR